MTRRLPLLVAAFAGLTTLTGCPATQERVTPTPEARSSPVTAATPATASAGCTDKPEVRYYGYAWNAQMGLMGATGGKQATKDSAMCKHGVNLKLMRQDDNAQLTALLVKFAEDVKAGKDNPADGAHFITVMGDGSAAFLKPLNDALTRLGPDYTAAIVGALGSSQGEDKFMGPAAWKADPAKSKGGVVAGVLRDGDWNIALKWLGDNKLKNNPDETSWDPDALNWVAANDYIDAAQKYVTGYCDDFKNKKTGKTEKKCVDAVVTWTPGDVTVAENKGGIVSIVSTRENTTQMPCVVIGNKKWMAAHPELVKGFLAAAFEGADAVNASEAALVQAAEVAAQVYGEKDAAYWMKYFKPLTTKDKTGLEISLGGSRVIGLKENLELFAVGKDESRSAIAQTYTTFGNIVVSQYPSLVPKIHPAKDVIDTTYLKALAAPAATN